MKLKLKYDDRDDIPNGYVELYTEKDGVWNFSGVEGMKTQADIDRLREGNKRERDEHKETKQKLKQFDGIDPDKVHDELEELEELRLSNGDKDDKDVDELVEQKIKRRLAPIERERDKLKEELDTERVTTGELRGEITSTQIHDVVRAAALEAKVQTTAIEDILAAGDKVFEFTEDREVLTKDGSMTAGDWLEQTMKQERPHWWPMSEGGGSQGSDGNSYPDNPWSKENWNMTAQAGVITAHGKTKADQMAKAAGSEVGATAPPA